MPNVLDPNPHLSILDGDGRVKEQIARQARRALDMADRMKELPSQTAEEIEAERFQYESNAYAADNPLYAAARAAAVNFVVVPLDGTTPLVDPSEATREPRKLFAWWLEYPSANVGVLLGRIGGLFALRVEDGEAWERLKEMAGSPCTTLTLIDAGPTTARLAALRFVCALLRGRSLCVLVGDGDGS